MTSDGRDADDDDVFYTVAFDVPDLEPGHPLAYTALSLEPLQARPQPSLALWHELRRVLGRGGRLQPVTDSDPVIGQPRWDPWTGSGGQT